MKKTTTLLILLLTAALFLINACDTGDDGKKYYITLAETVDTTVKNYSFSNTERFGFYRNGTEDTTWECSWGDDDSTITLPLEDPGSPGDPIETGTLFISGNDGFNFDYDNGDDIYYAASTEWFEMTLTNWSDTEGDVISGTFEGTLVALLYGGEVEVEGEFECIMTGVVSFK